MQDIKDRLAARIATEPNTGCWLWLGTLNGKAGYGMINIAGKHTLAHRAAYEAYKGAIPEGLVIDHKCRQRSCINPDHLRVVTSRENNIYSGQCKNKAGICKHGHDKRGRKDCAICNLACVRRRRAERRACRDTRRDGIN